MTASIGRMVAIFVLAGPSLASAAPPFSGGDLAGRERDRFVDPPIGRMIQQPPSVAPRFDGPADSLRCRGWTNSPKHRKGRRPACR